VDLGLDDNQLFACGKKLLGRDARGLRGVADVPLGDRNTFGLEQLLGLIFVDVHSEIVLGMSGLGVPKFDRDPPRS
jgi:hypothetical protein